MHCHMQYVPETHAHPLQAVSHPFLLLFRIHLFQMECVCRQAFPEMVLVQAYFPSQDKIQPS